MPMDADGKVNFTTTLFALIRENLSIKMRTGKWSRWQCWKTLHNHVNPTLADEMDQADSELRETITHIWPLQAKKMIDLLVPRSEDLNTGKLSVGKIYGGLLILESWRNTKFGQLETDAPVSNLFHFISISSLAIFPLLKLTHQNEFYLVSFSSPSPWYHFSGICFCYCPPWKKKYKKCFWYCVNRFKTARIQWRWNILSPQNEHKLRKQREKDVCMTCCYWKLKSN